MKKLNLIKFTAGVFCVMILFSCGDEKTAYKIENQSVNGVNSFATSKKMLTTVASRAAEYVSNDSITMEEADFEMAASGTENGKTGSEIERKIIRNGNVSIEVESLEKSAERIAEWASRFGGYVTNSWESESSANYTVKIPSEKFDEAFNETKTYGKFLNGNIYTDDITDQYYDLETRLEAKKILRTRLQGYLANAKETKELLNIEKELNNAVTEIESMEGRLRRMKDQVSFSTVTINLQLPYRTTDEGFQWPSWSDGIRRFGGNVLDFFIVILKVILYVIICGIPLLAIAALFYWILFGKVGLIKKLFKKLK